MITFVLLGAVSLLTGQGILSIGKIHTKSSIALYLSPMITLSFWTVFLGWGVLLGFSIKQLWIIGWSATILLAIIGSRRIDFEFLKREKASLAALVLFPVALMFPYFWYGLMAYPGSWFWDGWNYIAYAQYIFEYPRGTEGGLSPLYQHAATLNGARFIASSLIAFFSPLTGNLGNTQASNGYFLAHSVFVFSSACMSFVLARAKERRRMLNLVYVGMSVFSGWMVNILIANNYDNLLAISFLPAIAALLYSADSRKLGWAVILAGLIAAILYCYPEMAPFVICGVFLFTLQVLFQDRSNYKHWLLFFIAVAVVTVIFILPWRKGLVLFFQNQIHAALSKNIPRPGEGYFPQLMSMDCFFGAFWGFWAPFQGCKSALGQALYYKYFANIVAAFFSFLFLLGMFLLFKKKEWGIAAIVILLFCGTLFTIFNLEYDYGAYKFILLNWWGISYALFWGLDLFQSRFPGNKSNWIIFIVCGGFLIITGIRVIDANESVFPKNISMYKQVQEIRGIIKNESVALNLHEPKSIQWALYYLRDMGIYPVTYCHPYMGKNNPPSLDSMKRAKRVDISDTPYILTDGRETLSPGFANLVWTGAPYRLWEVSKNNWILITEVENMDYKESISEAVFWMKPGSSKIHLFSCRMGKAVLRVHFYHSPNSPRLEECNLHILTDRGFEKDIDFTKDGSYDLCFPVMLGENILIVTRVDNSRSTKQSNGESCSTGLEIRGLSVELEDYINQPGRKLNASYRQTSFQTHFHRAVDSIPIFAGNKILLLRIK